LAKRILIGLIALLIVGVLGLFALAWHPALPPIEPPAAASFSPELIATCEILAGAGNCAACHTAPDGKPYAGGLGLGTQFGTIYSTNITPDADTGIGRWSQAAFARALHEGVDSEGAQLFPAMPYTHFTKVSDADLNALYAFLMTRPAVKAEEKTNSVPFPFNVRALQAGWKLLFFKRGAYQADPGKSEEWNRGAYLVQGLGHCAGCHTPLNSLGAEKPNEPYAGARIAGWYAPALNAANTAPIKWSADELFAYLRTGLTARHGAAAGSMAEVVHEGLAKLPDADVRAIATLLSPMTSSDAAAVAAGEAKALAFAAGSASHDLDEGAGLYRAACSSCHYNSGSAPSMARPELAFSTSLTLPDPANLVHLIMDGVARQRTMTGFFMPGYAAGLTDTEIANLTAYLRASRTGLAPWTDVEATVKAIRKQDEDMK
jgi:mono/diheme cytochrome c family protein